MLKSLWEASNPSQLEVHGATISKEDINQKFLRSLPSSWNQIALIMRNKPDIYDLYNNLRVYEDELKRSSGSNSASQNLAFLSLRILAEALVAQDGIGGYDWSNDFEVEQSTMLFGWQYPPQA
ncbi:hypothetical protein Tco_0834940 [Tanacetum coccineum]